MVSQCRNSGKTVSAWCAENGITPKTYYYRQRRVCEAIPDTKADKPSLTQGVEESAFAEITPAVRHKESDTAIIVRFGSAEMEIHNGANPSVIEAALKLISKIC